MPHDAANPARSSALIPQRRLVREGLREGLLHTILGLRRVAQQPRRVTQRRRVVLPDELGEPALLVRSPLLEAPLVRGGLLAPSVCRPSPVRVLARVVTVHGPSK